ncbi:MAG: glycoside hydrolase family 9 protein [Oscillospiraceae bacterium]|nr:glycoside hydrolase family 9 protein [Oscillospiraceae bacterium]
MPYQLQKPKNDPLIPAIKHISAVSPSILSITVQEYIVTGGTQIPYEPMPGETLLLQDATPPYSLYWPHLVWIMKDGEKVGIHVKDYLGDKRFLLEKREGLPLRRDKADECSSYLINGAHPMTVYRKMKPNGLADITQEVCYEHVIYLVLQEPLNDGAQYRMDFAPLGLSCDGALYTHLPLEGRSDAINVSQVGFRPDDPAKRAYLSQWMGLGGGVMYTGGARFMIIDAKTGRTAFEGDARLQNDGGAVGYGALGDSVIACAPIYEMDFSALSDSGDYKVHVPGIGVSHVFSIRENAWMDGFKVSIKGLYHHRSGIESGPPYSVFTRPRVYHPDDGRVVYQSTCSLFMSGNGLNCYGTDTDNFGNLVKGRTDEVVDDAWGGYFDACDWDRRIQHLNASQLLLELYLMFPDVYGGIGLNIPESGDAVPDIISECLWNIDFYRRLQTVEGGIRGGIEAEEHPVLGQCGWQDSWTAFAYAPDFWSSHFYASAAARAAVALRVTGSAYAMVYEESAIRAMRWAEEDYQRAKKDEHKWTGRAIAGARNARELAAADMYRLTGDACYDSLYRSLRQDKSYQAAFIYSTLPPNMGDAQTRVSCAAQIVGAAGRALDFAKKTPYRLPTPDIGTIRTGPYSSFYTIPHMTELCRAHYITNDARFLAGAVDACQFACGANPDNLCYTTGVGHKWPMNILHHDSRITGQPIPDGITVFGPHNLNASNYEMVRFLRQDAFMPGAYAWPSTESYLDVYRLPCQCEYTVQTSIGPNAYNWGYLAARRK